MVPADTHLSLFRVVNRNGFFGKEEKKNEKKGQNITAQHSTEQKQKLTYIPGTERTIKMNLETA